MDQENAFTQVYEHVATATMYSLAEQAARQDLQNLSLHYYCDGVWHAVAALAYELKPDQEYWSLAGGEWQIRVSTGALYYRNGETGHAKCIGLNLYRLSSKEVRR